jgi:hypothetical protein
MAYREVLQRRKAGAKHLVMLSEGGVPLVEQRMPRTRIQGVGDDAEQRGPKDYIAARTGRSEPGPGAGKRPGAQIKTFFGSPSIVYTANSLRVTGVKKRTGLTCRYPCRVVVPTTTIGVISNAYDLLRATPSAVPDT